MSKSGKETSRKHAIISSDLRTRILSGDLPGGAKIDTERELANRYGVSRPTVTRALKDLADEGLIERRVGAGSFVSIPSSEPVHRTFGLMVPGLGRGEIFEPVCARIAERAATEQFTLSWGGSTGGGTTQEGLLGAVQRYIAQGVDGIFFQPTELNPSRERINNDIIDILKESRIPVVLLDADYLPFPERSKFDIVGIDNIRAAWVATDHFIGQGAKRVDFVTRPYTATTAERRIDGYRLSLLSAGIPPNPAWEHSLDPEDNGAVQRLVDSGARDIICVNDETAALIIPGFERLGFRVPEDIRVIGFDDVKYARLVRVPLTTLRQPCEAIGDAAVDAMLSRIARPTQAPREFLLEAEFMIRRSSIRPAE